MVPDLTVRERLFLERGIVSKQPAELAVELGFKTAAGMKVEEFLENYRK
jgi:hypothetical protein